MATVWKCVILILLNLVLCSGKYCAERDTCRLPDCFCLNSTTPPQNIASQDVPQIVVFAFDGSLNRASYIHYKHFFNGRYKNPNDCPMRPTLFVKGRYTNYTLLHAVHEQGFEIACNSQTGKLPISFWKDATVEDLAKEVVESRRQLSQKARIPVEDIVGWRSPHLQPTGDTQFKILEENGFVYDSSLYVQRRSLDSVLTWPGTMNFKWPFQCELEPCPKRNYSLWEIPVVSLLDHQQKYPCKTVGGCINKPVTESDAFQLLWRNFYNFYRSGKVPFVVNLKSGWLNTDIHHAAMDRFILSLLDIDDVFVVTMQQMIQWMKNPTGLSSIHEFEPWKCPQTDNACPHVTSALLILLCSCIGSINFV